MYLFTTLGLLTPDWLTWGWWGFGKRMCGLVWSLAEQMENVLLKSFLFCFLVFLLEFHLRS